MPSVVKFCADCGTQIPVDAAFCLKCGARQTPAEPEHGQRSTYTSVLLGGAGQRATKPKRSWIRSVPGFRSGTWWKAAIAVLFIYFPLAFALLVAAFPSTERRSTQSGGTTPAFVTKSTLEATAEPQVLMTRLDTAWTKGDWAEAIGILEQLKNVAPEAMDYNDKLYAAHFFNGKQLLEKGRENDAIDELTKANQVDPARTDAKSTLLVLTPTPTPLPSSAQRIETIAKKVLGNDFRKVEMGSPVYPIVSATFGDVFGNLVWSAGNTADRFVELAPQVFDIPEVQVMTFSVYATLVDTYGKETDGRIAYLNITRETANKVNWSNFDSRNVNRLLKGDGDAVALINLEFRKGWNSFQNK